MTVQNVTPTGDTNQPTPIVASDDQGNPLDENGNVQAPVQDGMPDNNTPADNNEDGETKESLRKALKDTKAALTKAQQGIKDDQDNEDTEENNTPTNLEIQQQAEESTGLDLQEYFDEYQDKGELTQESYDKLAEQGLGKQIVDDFIAGQNARVANETREVAAVVGGEDNLNAVLEWAGENLSEAEINAYNSATQQGKDSAKLALQGLYSRYTAENGSSPNLIGGQTGGESRDVFKSSHEMTKAMEDPRYWKDPDYQKEVQDKISRSHKAGTI